MGEKNKALSADVFIPSAPDNFITVWRVPANQVITIPVSGDLKISWGDGCIDTLRGVKRSCEHVYVAAGDYTISVSNTAKWGSCNDSLMGFKGMAYNKSGEALEDCGNPVWHGTFEGQQINDKLIDVVQWGTTQWVDMTELFKGCFNMTMSATDAPDLSRCKLLYSMFSGAAAFNSPIDHWDVSKIISMGMMFKGASCFNQELAKWDLSFVSNTWNMFQGANDFCQDLSDWTCPLEYEADMFEPDFPEKFKPLIGGPVP